MKLTNKQQEKLNLLIDEYVERKNGVYFKAPTGSGKTFIIAKFIDEITKRKLSNEKLIFIIGTISSSELPVQMKIKLDNYAQYLSNDFKNILINSPSKEKKQNESDVCNVFQLPKYNENLVYILGTSSFNKNSLFYDYGCFKNFIKELTENNYKIIYIRDEAHIGGSNLSTDKLQKSFEEKNFDSLDNLLNRYANFILKLTATPKLDNLNQIVLYEKELEEDSKKLLKNNLERFTNIYQDVNDYELLKLAINQFKKIQKDYKESPIISKFNINPAMIIQVSSNNKFNYDKNEKFRNDIDDIKKWLDEAKMRWVLYFGDKKEESKLIRKNKINLQDISQNDSNVEVIIIKVGPSIGWDIPRACMLLQLRSVYSATLNVQTVGRIKRNPIPTLEDNDLARTYWLYSNYQESQTEMANYRLEDKYIKNINNERENIQFYSGELTISKTENSKYNNKVYYFFEEEMKKIDILNLIDDFINNYKRKKWNRINVESITNSETQSTKKHYQEINSYFDLFKIINNVEFGKDLNQCIYTYFNTQNLEKYIDLIQFKYILFYLETVLFRLKEGISKIRKEDLTENNYQIMIDDPKYLPNEYSIWKRKQLNNVTKDINIALIKSFFPYRNQDQNEIYKLYNDSSNESGIIAHFKEDFEDLCFNEEKEIDIKKLKLFSINPALRSGIKFQYLNYENEFKSSYPDWVIKYNNINLYLEFKSIDDYDNRKTNNLFDAYKKYACNESKNYFGIAYGKNFSKSNIKNVKIMQVNLFKNNNEEKQINYVDNQNLLLEIINYISQ